MIKRTICLSGSNRLQQLAREAAVPYYSGVGGSAVDKHSSALMLKRKANLNVLCQQGDQVYG